MKTTNGNKQIVSTTSSAAVIAFAISGLLLSACGTSNSGSGATAASNATTSSTSTLQLTSAGTTVVESGTLQFTAMGGASPYTYSVFSGPPDVSMNPTTGLFAAGLTTGSVTVQVVDSAQNLAYALISVTASGTGNGTPTSGYPMNLAYAPTNFGPDFVANNAVDGSASTAYSSAFFSSQNNGSGAYLAAWLTAGQTSVSAVYMTARMVNGVPLGFPVSYNIQLTTSNNSKWFTVGTYTTQPDVNGNVRIALPTSYLTYGVLLQPILLGPDSYASYALEMAEISIGN